MGCRGVGVFGGYWGMGGESIIRHQITCLGSLAAVIEDVSTFPLDRVAPGCPVNFSGIFICVRVHSGASVDMTRAALNGGGGHLRASWYSAFHNHNPLP
jgi:hypothetical protein